MKTMKSKTKKNPKRFYITRTAVNNPLMLKTLNDAVNAGRSSVETHNDAIYVVEIVKVIKREKPPVGVFDFMLEDWGEK